MAKTIIKIKRNPSLINDRYLKHSAKGSSWKKHKYIKKVGDKYVYANTKNGVEEESENSKANADTTNEEVDPTKKGEAESETPEEFDLETMANKVIRGEFGNGAERKELLGDSYADIQKRVNEILKGTAKQTTDPSKSIDAGKKAADKVLGTTGNSKKVNMTR